MTTTAPRKSGIKKNPAAASKTAPATKRTTKRTTKPKALAKVTQEVQVAHVPDQSVADRYIGRKVNGVKDFDLFDYCYENGVNLLLEGPTGPGKTMASRAWAARRGMRVARIPSHSGIDASQLFGRPIPYEDGFKWVDGSVTVVWREGGLILWNEINFTPERVGSVMFGALDDNREIVLMDHDGEVIRAHRGAGKCWCDLSDAECDSRRVIIVADMNPGYAGTRELNDALRNRFGVQVYWDYDDAVEKQLVASKNLLKMAKQIRRDEGYETPVSTNMLMEFERFARDLSIDFAIANFVNHFRIDERDPIRLVCDTHKAGIDLDYNPPQPQQEATEQQSQDDEVESAFDMTDVADWIFTSDD